MAELENEVEYTSDDDLDLDLNESEETDYDDNQDDEPDGISYEQAMEWKKKALRLDKAEKKLVELKKQSKDKTNINSNTDGEFITKKDLEIEKFITKNPELEDYKEDIKSYLNKGLSLQEAKIIVENSDKASQNRKKLEQTNISSSEGRPSKKVYTKSQLAELDSAEYNKIKDLADAGKVVIRW